MIWSSISGCYLWSHVAWTWNTAARTRFATRYSTSLLLNDPDLYEWAFQTFTASCRIQSSPSSSTCSVTTSTCLENLKWCPLLPVRREGGYIEVPAMKCAGAQLSTTRLTILRLGKAGDQFRLQPSPCTEHPPGSQANGTLTVCSRKPEGRF